MDVPLALNDVQDPGGVIELEPLLNSEVETCTPYNGDSISARKSPLTMEQSTEPQVCEESMSTSAAAESVELLKEPVSPAAAESTQDVKESLEPKAVDTPERMDSALATGVDEDKEDPIKEADPAPLEHMEDSIDRLKNSILDHISQNTEAYFKSQQKDEPDLTIADKWKIAETLLIKSAPTFLSRYAKYLLVHHLDYFSDSDDSLVQYYVEQRHNELKKSSSYSKATVRNRRLEALKRLSEKGEYFSDKEMKRRNPLLFEELVGQFLTNDQKFEFETTGDAQPTSFAAFFMDIVEKDFAVTKMMKEVESDVSMMTTGEPSQSSSNVVLWGEMAADSRSKQRVLNNSRPQEVSEDEKHNLLNEFRSKVFTDFLGGRDDEFDYNEVDKNADYDDLNAMEQDQQEGYFDSESPQTVMDEDSNSGCQIGVDYDELESHSPSPEMIKSDPT